MSHAWGQAVGLPAPGGPDADGDAALIAQSLRDPDRFGALFDRHAPTIFRYVARRLGPDAADDVTAETFLQAFRQRHDYDSARGDARPWLYGIATNLIGRHRRDEVRFFRAIARTGVDPAAEPIADQITRQVAAQAISKQLAAALACLSQGQRDVLLLAASGLSYEEAACALGVPIGTVSSRLVRARGKLRNALGGVNPADEQGE